MYVEKLDDKVNKYNNAYHRTITINYLVKIIDDSVITCDEIIEERKAVPTNSN